MDAQLIAVLALVALAVFFVVRRLWRNAKGHADGACDKCSDPSHKP